MTDLPPEATEAAEPDDPQAAAIYWTNRWADSAGLVTDILSVLSDIADHAAPISEDEHGFVAGGYMTTVGAMHRALAFLTQHGVPIAAPQGQAGVQSAVAVIAAAERQRIRDGSERETILGEAFYHVPADLLDGP